MLRATPDLQPDFQILLDASADAVIVVDAHGTILVLNEEAVRMFGFAADALSGKSLETLIPGETLAAYVDYRRGSAPARGRLRMGEHPPTRGRRADRTEFPINVGIFPVGEGEDRRVAVIVRDAAIHQIAERAVSEARTLTAQLNSLQKIQAIGRLAGGVAHDFNNLLQVIGGHVDSMLVTAPEDDSPDRRQLLGIRRAVDRAASLTRQLLAFGRRQVLRPKILNLNAVVESLESMLKRVMGEDIRIETALVAALKPVEVDPGQIEQVVLNLTMNARDAMSEAGGMLRIETANVELTSPMVIPALPVKVPAGSWVRLSVRDTGMGMDAETVEQAYEPFFTTKDPHRGSGLGLSQIYGIVKQSGGYTWIDSAPRQGTTVSILLPAIDADLDPLESPETAPEPAALHGPAIILVVEDDDEVRELLSAFLGDVGYTVLTAADGRDALKVFEANADRINLIVTDVVMPHASGPFFARAAKARRPDLPILYLSGYDEERRSSSKADLDDPHLQKPVSRNALLARVAELLERPRG